MQVVPINVISTSRVGSLHHTLIPIDIHAPLLQPLVAKTHRVILRARSGMGGGVAHSHIQNHTHTQGTSSYRTIHSTLVSTTIVIVYVCEHTNTTMIKQW